MDVLLYSVLGERTVSRVGVAAVGQEFATAEISQNVFESIQNQLFTVNVVNVEYSLDILLSSLNPSLSITIAGCVL